MSHLQVMLWLCVASYGFHVAEEFIFDWRNWARQVLHLPARGDDFYVTNCLVIVLGIVAVFIAPEFPAIALGFPGLMLINGTFMHVFPFILKRGRFSPGLITSILLFWPIGVLTMLAAQPDVRTVIIALFVGATMLATPIGFIVLKQRPYFDQTRPT
jgi:uncharacterized protein with HXXEE motif